MQRPSKLSVSSPAVILYGIAKVLSLIIAVIALIVAIVLGFSMLTGSRSFHVPNFDAQARTSFLSNLSGQQANIAEQKTQLKLTNEYGSKIIALISAYNISAIKDQGVIHFIKSLPRAYRGDVVSGWKEYLQNGISYAKRTGVYRAETTVNQNLFGGSQPSTADQLTSDYFNSYQAAINDAQSRKKQDQIKNMIRLGVIVSALIIFIMAVIVPILVQMEKNTRLLAAQIATPAPAAELKSQTTSATSGSVKSVNQCPECHASISADDVFCGNCGHPLR